MVYFFSSVNAFNDASTRNRSSIAVTPEIAVGFINKSDNLETTAKVKQPSVASHQSLLKQTAELEIPISNSATSQPSNPGIKNDQVQIGLFLKSPSG